MKADRILSYLNRCQIRENCAKALAVSLVLAALLAVVANGRGAAIRGTVLDPDGRPAPRAEVTLLPALAPLQQRQSDARGQYAFEDLAAGVYLLVATLPGFSTSGTQVELREGETRPVDLHLALSAVRQQVVVAASLKGTLVPQIGSSVSVVSHQEMADRGAQNILEVLRGIPGVEVNQTGRRGGVTGVFIRGGNSNYNLVMVDGIQINQFGGDFDFAPLTVGGLDRVEVIRGPESALYGSNAVTGVVNLVTRQGDGPPHFSLLEEAGSFTTWRIAVGGAGLTHGLGWAVHVDRLDSAGVVKNDNYRDQTASFSLDDSRSSRRQVSFHFFGNANDAGAPGPYGSDPDNLYDAPIFPGGPSPRDVGLSSRDKENIFGYTGTYSEQFSSRFRQVATGTLATNDYYFSSPLGDSYSNNLRGVLNIRSEISVSAQDLFIAGFEYNHEQIKNTFIADSQGHPFLLPRTSLAYFAEDRWSPSGRVFLTAGLRIDDIRTGSLPADAFGERPLLPAGSVVKVNPRVSVASVLHASDNGGWLGATRLHGSFGTGIRAPDGFELAFHNNPHLRPEQSLSFDSGVEQRFARGRAILDATYFYNRFEDQIVVLGGSLTNLSTFTSANLGNARAEGVEASLRIRPVRSLEFEGEYTRVNSSILALDGTHLVESPFEVGQPLIRRPRNSGGYNVTWRHGQLMLNTNGYVRGSVLDIEPNDGTFACELGLPCLFTNKGYTLVNAGLSYNLRGLEIYGRLNNLLNKKYEESFGFPALHFNFLAGIRFSFPAE